MCSLGMQTGRSIVDAITGSQQTLPTIIKAHGHITTDYSHQFMLIKVPVSRCLPKPGRPDSTSADKALHKDVCFCQFHVRYCR